MKWVMSLMIFFPMLLAGQIPIPTLPSVKPGGSTVEVLNNTSVSLGANNYLIVRTNVSGRAKGFKLLGFITIKSASSSLAMSRLYANAGVQEGRPQAMANLIHERSSMYLILFSIPKARVRADLIEFTDGLAEGGRGPDAPPPRSRVRTGDDDAD